MTDLEVQEDKQLISTSFFYTVMRERKGVSVYVSTSDYYTDVAHDALRYKFQSDALSAIKDLSIKYPEYKFFLGVLEKRVYHVSAPTGGIKTTNEYSYIPYERYSKNNTSRCAKERKAGVPES